MRESPFPLEQSLGIGWYATRTPGIGGYLRREPEDFVVEEESAGPWGDAGQYLILRLMKRNWEQQRLVKELARILGISHHRISWAGTKDRRAVTTQYISIHKLEPEAIARVTLPDASLEVTGRSEHPIHLGELRGNRFTIQIRDCDTEDLAGRVGDVTRAGITGFPNYVGIQRFGVIRPITHVVGERILKRDLEGAVMTYLGASFPAEQEDVKEAREAFSEGRDVKDALRRFPIRLSFERAMLHHLDGQPEDWKGALEILPPRLLSLFVSAYQSFLFNTLLTRRCGQGVPLDKPTPGDRLLFADRREDRVTVGNLDAAALQMSRGRAVIGLFVPGSGGPPPNGREGDPAWQLLGEIGLSGNDFSRAAKLVGAAYGGLTRPIAVTAEISHRIEGTDVTLRFFLGPGRYATTVLREFMKVDPMRMI